MNILIVDDKEENRYLLRSLLVGHGHHVAEAPNGKKALEILEAGTWDLVISDILMPVMDGYQLCREIRSRECFRQLPFVFYTATYIEKKDEEFALKLGADRFFRKPIDPGLFMEHIRNLFVEFEKPRIEPRSIVPGDEKEFLTLYNERLVHKLEAKMLNLEKEIAERKRAEEKIAASLKEKEVLLKEIHHRVKNNMQIISSLINLPVRGLQASDAMEMLRQVKLRIRSMAMVHDKLYKSGDLARIDFGEFLQDLAVHHFQFFQIEKERITLTMKTESIMLSLEAALPCGMIAGELISNALKHAFPAERRGEITVGLRRLDGDGVLLSVRDDGVGFPEGLDIQKAETMGLVIINALVGQIEGRLEIIRDGGTEFRAIFAAP